MLRRLVVRIIFLGSLSLALVAVSGLPAAAQPTVTVELGQTATLVARGAAVQVPVIYSCSPDAAFTALSVTSTSGLVATASRKAAWSPATLSVMARSTPRW